METWRVFPLSDNRNQSAGFEVGDIATRRENDRRLCRDVWLALGLVETRKVFHRELSRKIEVRAVRADACRGNIMSGKRSFSSEGKSERGRDSSSGRIRSVMDRDLSRSSGIERSAVQEIHANRSDRKAKKCWRGIPCMEGKDFREGRGRLSRRIRIYERTRASSRESYRAHDRFDVANVALSLRFTCRTRQWSWRKIVADLLPGT